MVEGDPPTMHDVAARAGVALSSVSRVLSKHPDVSEKMRARVLQAAAELDYEPDYLAQSLRLGSTMTVGFTVRDISNPIFAGIAKGAETALRQRGYSMLMADSEGDPDVELSHLTLFKRRRVDGYILSLASEIHGPTFAALTTLGRPMVVVDRDVPSLNVGVVLCDHYLGARDAVSHLLALGHTRIAFISGEERLRATRERLRGYRDAHAAAGVKVDEKLLSQGRYAEEYGSDAAEAALKMARPPTGIFAGGLQLSIGALSALRARNLTLGSGFGFVACDALPIMRVLEPGLSVVSRDPVEIGQQTAAELMRQIDGQPPSTTVVPTTFVP